MILCVVCFSHYFPKSSILSFVCIVFLILLIDLSNYIIVVQYHLEKNRGRGKSVHNIITTQSVCIR